MLDFFLSTLDVRRRINNVADQSDETKKPILDEIQNTFIKIQKELQNRFDETQKRLRMSANADNAWYDVWNDAYRLQRLMAIVEPPESLFLELTRITNQSVEEGIPAADRLKKSFDQATKDLMDSPAPLKIKAGTEINIRMLLLDALEQFQWSKQRKFLARPYQKQAARRTVAVGFFAFIMFILPYAYLYFSIHLTHAYPEQLHWPWLPGYSALFSGLFGAFFSRLIFLQTSVRSMSLGTIADARHWTTILLRGIVGMCGALIVYFFLQSGLITGSVFPDFGDLGIHSVNWTGTAQDHGDISHNGITWYIVLPDKALALLVVWSFLAGFSERLVPNILASTEKRLTDATQK